MNITDAVEVLYNLNAQVIGTGAGRHERPHKPVLLLAIFDALAEGRARPDLVPWCEWLRERFRRYFDLVKSHNDECSPENPFLYLRSDGFWMPVNATPTGEAPLTETPAARDLDTGRVFARFIGGWDVLVANPDYRMGFRDALVSRYFPHARRAIAEEFIEPSALGVPAEPAVAEELPEETAPGRSSAFRRRVLEIYDFQCVACGLRIWLPERELSFVDAAHLVPFAETRNDHPTNGLALCKNHHWALDQRLIAPDPSATWRVSRHLEPRRSRGEEELARLAGNRCCDRRSPPSRRSGMGWSGGLRGCWSEGGRLRRDGARHFAAGAHDPALFRLLRLFRLLHLCIFGVNTRETHEHNDSHTLSHSASGPFG